MTIRNKSGYTDRAKRTGSERPDYLSIVSIIVGVVALVTLLLYLGVIADAFISLVEMV